MFEFQEHDNCFSYTIVCVWGGGGWACLCVCYFCSSSDRRMLGFRDCYFLFCLYCTFNKLKRLHVHLSIIHCCVQSVALSIQFRTLLRLESKAYSLRWMRYICRMYAKIGDGVFLFTDFDSISQTHGWLASHVDYIRTKFEGATTLARLNVSAPKIVSSRSLSTTTTSKGQRDAQNKTFIPESSVRGPIRQENVLLA